MRGREDEQYRRTRLNDPRTPPKGLAAAEKAHLVN
jgi:hypothetical protein